MFLGFLAFGLAFRGGGANGRAEGSSEEVGIEGAVTKDETAIVVRAWDVVSIVVEEETVKGRVGDVGPIILLERVDAVVTVGGVVAAVVTATEEDEGDEKEESAVEAMTGS